MTSDSRKALESIRQCVKRKQFQVNRHFTQRQDERGLFWADVLAVLNDPNDVHEDGCDDEGRLKWVIEGEATDGLSIGVVCVLDENERGRMTVFITLFWND